ncbi:CTAG/PCC1 family protein [Fervidicoccus fontis]|jgi:tRNA threonylcarbamoyladenosine modification (KEOPS) complex  Pcc1 subunit|uniref:Uncharacterized protein n=2 Tax=Fervidicoccus fontis TaxID=683846 RepID=I0A2X3_FERFK|nr:KEOPS complex subunit Pcc1 [Fervidicoccus fontis]AFH43330.1 hypothetical protein FFONT_1342 [Fervidicoccus fontis Kam940]MBE9390706.1 CTAG/PCC1 family protein [Fervidicoccus fontis]PMB76409.1 MAG: hypothetical protein C0177_06185 [Fervidicoccus fontis]
MEKKEEIEKISFSLEIHHENEKLLKAYFESLKPEADSLVNQKKGKVFVEYNAEEKKLILKMETETISDFKALMNSYLYLIKAINDSLNSATSSMQ